MSQEAQRRQRRRSALRYVTVLVSSTTRWVAVGRMAICGLAVYMTAAPAAAQEPPPIEVESVDLRTGETVAAVVIRAETPLEWSIETGKQTLVLFLPHAVPGPEALDRSSRAGLISLVEVGFAVPGGVPTARITVHSRKPFEHEVELSGAELTLRLTAGGGGANFSETLVEGPVEPRLDSTAADSEELEEVLRENDRLRQRVTELHSDRLELRDSLDSARRSLADRTRGDVETVRTAELESENQRLAAELEAEKARLAESRGDSYRLSAQIEQLTQSLEAVRRELRALLAEVNLAQLTISPDADPCLAVRAGPGEDQRRLDCLEPGTTVSIVDASPGWLSITAPGEISGWVASRFVEPRHRSESR